MPEYDDTNAPAPSAAEPDEIEETKRYGRKQLRCTLADRLIDLIYLAVAAFILAVPLDRFLATWPPAQQFWPLRLALLFLVITALHLAVSFPLSYYSGFRLEHEFALSTLSLRGWLARYAKRVVLSVALMLVLLIGLYWIIHWSGPWWWCLAAVAFFAVSVVLGQLMPVLILPLFYKIEPLDDEDLATRMTKLAQGTGLTIQGVYRMALSEETVKANAMLAGLGRTRRVLMGDTLLDNFTPEEIEVVFAHEIGHHVHRHIRKMIALGVLTSLMGFWICDRVLHWWIARVDGTMDYARWPEYIYALPLIMLALSVFGLLLEPVNNAVGRHFERQSDRYALDRTGNSVAYRSAFRKLGKLNKDDFDPPRLEVLLFHGHPPIGERLAMADRAPGD